MNTITNWNDLPLALTAEQVRKVLGVSKPVVYTLINRADFPCVQVSPNRKIIPKEQFIRWLENQAGSRVS